MELPPALPFDILLHIALTSPAAWIRMLAIPDIARYARDHQEVAMEQFMRKVETDEMTAWILPNRWAHSLHDRPAVVRKDGRMFWYRFNQIHRDGDAPAIMGERSQMWYKYDQPHRDGAPAQIDSDGLYIWIKEGQYHHEDGPAFVHRHFFMWFKNGRRHRDGGPAHVNEAGRMEWWKRDEIQPDPSRLTPAARDAYCLRLWREQAETFLPHPMDK